jgi:c-di-GMP-related signal transduction protein
MENDVYVARQPILDRRGAVVAQELLFRDCRSGVADIHDGFACTTTVVKRVLGAVGIESVLGDVEGFLNCTDEFLFSDFINLLPASRFVLEVLEDTELTPELGARCDVLRQAGFRIALDDVREITPALSEFLTHVDIVKLDWPYIAVGEVAAMVVRLKRAGKLVLAEKVEQRSEHEAAMRAGCDLFQGFYFAKPQLLAVKRAQSSFASVLRVLQLLTDDASDVDLEQALKNAPTLIVQLLRLANSSTRPQARGTPITSIRQALSVVGSRQLMRWCCLLLYGNATSLSSENDPLVRLVERRAGFMELAAQELTPEDDRFRQAAYLSGMLSLAHVSQGVDVEVFVTDLPVGAVIQAAIIDHHGELGDLLSIAEHLEAGRYDTALQQSQALGPAFVAKLPVLMQ